MAYSHATDKKFFTPIGGQSARGNAPAMWAYKTQDNHAAVDAAGYFDALSTLLSVGDIINVVVVTNRAASNEATATYGPHLVNANAAGVVDVTNVTIGVVTDSD